MVVKPPSQSKDTIVKIKMVITGRQIAAARELIRMTQADLAVAAGVGENTVYRVETSETAARAGTLEKLTRALELRGIEFLNGGEPGVRLRPSKAVIPV